MKQEKRQKHKKNNTCENEGKKAIEKKAYIQKFKVRLGFIWLMLHIFSACRGEQ